MWFSSFFNTFFNKKKPLLSLQGLEGIHFADAVFHNLIVEGKVPGISVGIKQDGETILQKGYGYSNLEKRKPVDPLTDLFRIASISKCITGLAFGKMVEEGILHYDDSFFKYVPYYPKKQFDFTLRQLAAHTAGIRGYRGKEFALNKPYSIKDSIEVFKDDSLLFEPAKGYLYNSFDFVLLSLAMQEASGVPFQDYVREKVLSPLGMKNTLSPNEILKGTGQEYELSTFYTKHSHGFKKAIDVNNFYKVAGGGYLSTSEDIALLGQAILDNRLLKPETYDQLLASQRVNEKLTYYGLGFQVSQDNNGNPFIGHIGNSVGTYTNFFVYPKDKTVIAILINCSQSAIQQSLDKGIEAFLPFTQK